MVVRPDWYSTRPPPLDYLLHVMDKLDLILIMSVNPGFGGQSFIPHALKKIETVRAMIDSSGRQIMLEVDGGVKVDNIAEIAGGRCRYVRGRFRHFQPAGLRSRHQGNA